MKLVLQKSSGRQAVDVQLDRDDQVKIAHLARRAWPEHTGPLDLILDGVVLPHDTLLAEAGLYEGAVLRVSAGAVPAQAMPSWAVEIRTVAGLEAGQCFPLPRVGTYSVGSEPGCDIVLPASLCAPKHAEVRLDDDHSCWIRHLVPDAGPLRDWQRFVDGEIALLGAVALTVDHHHPGDAATRGRTSASGTATFYPFARREQAAPPRKPNPPQYPELVTPSTGVVWASNLSFLLVGVVGAIVYSPFFLLFGLAMVITWPLIRLEEKLRAKRKNEGLLTKFAEDLADFERTLEKKMRFDSARMRVDRPGPAEIRRRALTPSTRLWERKVGHSDFLVLSCGVGDVSVRDETDWDNHHEQVRSVLSRGAILRQAPMELDLGKRRSVGVVGSRPHALAVVRNLITQVAVLHGPAQVRLAVLTTASRVSEWDWTKWLPHVLLDHQSDYRFLARTELEARRVIERLQASTGRGEEEQVTLVVLDLDDPVETMHRLLAEPNFRAIVLGTEGEPLPCEVLLRPDTTNPLQDQVQPRYHTSALIAGISQEAAETCSIALARYSDPNLRVVGSDLPASLSLLDLLGRHELTPTRVLQQWESNDGRSVAAPIGVTASDVVNFDMAADGPHGFIIGMTQSGKTNLLLTFVASSVARFSPETLNFFLIDYKGGTGFGAYKDSVPHVRGFVTELTELDGDRALAFLGEELRVRKSRHAEAGVSTLDQYTQGNHQPPLPRLIIILDELGQFVREAPNNRFVDSLVTLASQGAAFGMHLLLSTQVATGVLNSQIGGNITMWVALRTENGGDSDLVLGSPVAATIGARQKGRAYVRLGAESPVPFQTASVFSLSGRKRRRRGASLRLKSFPFAPEPDGGDVDSNGDGQSMSDLPRILQTVIKAADADNRRSPRPALEPQLPADLSLDSRKLTQGELTAGGAPFALIDQPRSQWQGPYCWELSEGNLGLYGAVRSGTTTALAAIILAATRRYAPNELRVDILDLDSQALLALQPIPHVRAIGAQEEERQLRLLHSLVTEIESRQASAATGTDRRARPALLLVVDKFLRSTQGYDRKQWTVEPSLRTIMTQGPNVGVNTIVSATDFASVPPWVLSSSTRKLLFWLAEPYDYTSYGLPSHAHRRLIPGRAIDVSSRDFVQVANPGDLTEAAKQVAGLYPSPEQEYLLPPPIGVLPDSVALAEILAHGRYDARTKELVIPLGKSDSSLEVTGFSLRPRTHALVLGDRGSGKTETLQVVAACVRYCCPDAVIVAVAGKDSALAKTPAVSHCVETRAHLAAEWIAAAADRPTLILIDAIEGASASGDSLFPGVSRLHDLPPHCRVIAACSRDQMGRLTMDHWLHEIERSYVGIVLQPRSEYDASVWEVTIPSPTERESRPMRGYLIQGKRQELVQVASMQ